MKRLLTFISALALASASACSSDDGGAADISELVVSGGETSESYSRADLEALDKVESEFNGTAYAGVPVEELVADAGFDPAAVKAVKAVASDGFTVNYDPGQVFTDGVIVAYALADGSDMSGDDGTFRMVLPDGEGKLNVRMLVELQVTE